MRRHISIWQGLWKKQEKFDAVQEKTHFLVTDCRDEHGTTRHLKHPSTAAAVHEQNLKVLNCKVPLFVLQWKSITKPLQHTLCQRGTEEPNKRTLNLNQLQYPWAFPESVHFISIPSHQMWFKNRSLHFKGHPSCAHEWPALESVA